MTGFSKQFEHFVPPDPDTIRIGITSGLVVLDSNVLLSAYRFAPDSRSELLRVLELVEDRLWIPHQVGLEFHRNRLKVIAEHDAAYREAIDTVEQRRKEFLPALQNKVRELSNRVALPDRDRDELLGILDSSFARLDTALHRLRNDHGVGQPAAPDDIFDRIGTIFSGKMGDRLTGEDAEAELAEALSRIEKKAPPGYKDSDKDEPHGDYFVWCQALREAKRRQSDVLVLVTNDAKEDWYLRLKGQTVMARPELAQECAEKSGARLVMLSARAFLSHARKYLEVEVSDETIRQAERVQTVDDDRRIENAKQRVDALIRDEAEHTARLDKAQNEQARLQADLDRARFGLGRAREQEESLSAHKAAGTEISEADLSRASKQASDLQLQVTLAEDRISAARQEVEHETKEMFVKRTALNAAIADFHRLKKEAGA